MSDSFADLWSSSVPLPPKNSQQQTLSSISSSSGSGPQRQGLSRKGNTNKPDVFSLLASSGVNSSSGPRYGGLGGGSGGNIYASGSGTANNGALSRTGNPPSSSSSSRPITPAMTSLGGRSNSNIPAPTASRVNGDAFSDVFSSSGTPNGITTNMTLAARLAMEAKARQGSSASPVQKAAQSLGSAGGDAWAGLDSLASGGGLGLGISPIPVRRNTTTTNSRNVNVDDDDDWGLGDFGSSATRAQSAFISTTTTTTSAPVRTQSQSSSTNSGTKPASLWDLDDFASPQPAGLTHSSLSSSSRNLNTQSQRPISRTGSSQSGLRKEVDTFQHEAFNLASPDADFDFGNREDDYPASARSQGRNGIGRGLLDSDDERDGFGSVQRTDHAGFSSIHPDEDDILGMLSQPVEAVKAKTGRRTNRNDDLSWHAEIPETSTNTTSRPTHRKERTSSPPPHILGQIVEMGFSVQQAREALRATRGGQDVQAALESLLNGGSQDQNGGSTRLPSPPPPPPPATSRGPPPAPEVPSAVPRARGPPKGQKERERERLDRQRQASVRAAGGEGPGSTVQASVAEIQEQADKLLAQASEIGLSVFSKASAFWKEGKEKVVKAYEERSSADAAGITRSDSRGSGSSRTTAAAVGGRPKWMQELVHKSDKEDEGVGKGGFKDDHEDHGHDEPRRRPQHQQQQQQIKVEEVEVEIDLFATDTPAAPRPSASQPPPRSLRQTASNPSTSPRNSRTPTSRPAAQASVVPPRSLITALPSALAQAQKHKTDGTQKFKLGQHAAAADAYSSSINALPKGHLLLVPLHTNRALARLKTGEYGGAVEDCQRALEGIFGKAVFGGWSSAMADDSGLDPLAPKRSSGNSPAPPFLDASVIPPNLITAGKARSNNGGWADAQGVGVDLLDAYVKALRRAAEAFEGRERWADAGVWWGVLSRSGESAGATWVDEKSRKEAVSGSVRCRKMLDGSSSSSSTPAGPSSSSTSTKPPIKPRPKPHPAATSTEPSKALQALQTSTAEAEADDAAKHALKDSVDARIGAWKGGKETNIRALLGSLENVLWEGPMGVGGLKMGMADLVSAAQVKKNYMKAIGRVHPDKLNASNSTIEQRMLAGAIFGALNEAWIAFQATQK